MRIDAASTRVLAALGSGASLEEGLSRALELLVRLTRARAGALSFVPPRGARVSITAGPRLSPALDRWLREVLAAPKRAPASPSPPGSKESSRPAVLQVPLGPESRPVGRLLLLSIAGPHGLDRNTVPVAFARAFGVAVEHFWRLRQGRLRSSVMKEARASARRARHIEALYEAGGAVNRSLDVTETIRVILEQARDVLGAESCGLMAVDPVTGELSSVGSLDLAEETLSQIRIRVGEGITGLAVLERRPIQSADLHRDSRVRFSQLPREAGLRSMLAAPLLVGDRVIGAITVFRKDVHRFAEDEEHLLSAFADQAAMALEHARLFASVTRYSEQLEAMVADRTRALDEQKRFVEVVLETLPLGLYVLDRELSVVSVNRAGVQVLPCQGGPGCPFLSLVPADNGGALGEFLRGVFATRGEGQIEEEIVFDG